MCFTELKINRHVDNFLVLRVKLNLRYYFTDCFNKAIIEVQFFDFFLFFLLP